MLDGGMEKREPAYTVGGNVNWYNYYGKQSVEVPQGTLKTELPYDPAILLLGLHPDKTIIQRGTCTNTFIAETWEQPKCPLTDKWIKKMWYTHAHTHMLEYYSAIKKSMMPFAATRMDLESMVLSEISQTKINTIWYHLCMEPKTWYKWTYLWNKSRHPENRLVTAKEAGEGRERLEVWDLWMQTTIHGMVKQQGPTVEHRNDTQYPVINHSGKDYEKE